MLKNQLLTLNSVALRQYDPEFMNHYYAVARAQNMG